MKEAKRHTAMHRCESCAKTIKLRHGTNHVACTAHLTVLPADHAADCDEYEPITEQPTSVGAEAHATPEDSPKAP
ncbi:MAG: hypothetical protein Q8J80_06130 [Gallionella sp.]|nr:hypothetical protein [Gallionella sp.]